MPITPNLSFQPRLPLEDLGFISELFQDIPRTYVAIISNSTYLKLPIMDTYFYANTSLPPNQIKGRVYYTFWIPVSASKPSALSFLSAS